MLMVTILGMDAYGYVTVQREDGKSATVREDCYCSIARYYGWNPCEHEECCDITDGSVDCAHHTTDDMVMNAGEFLANHVGDSCDDPGWWD